MSDEMMKSPDSKRSFVMGIVTGIAVLVVLGGVFMMGSKYGSGGDTGTKKVANTNVNQPSQPNDPGIPQADVTKIPPVTNADHIRGTGKVTMIEYSDFECPYCERFHSTVTQILNDYKGKVRLVYRQFPLRQIHPDAQKAAEASECAAQQNKFWEMHDKLFQLNAAKTLSVDDLKKAAVAIGLNASKFNTCLDNGEAVAAVEAQYQGGLAGGVSGTPGTFIGSQYIPGALPYADVKAAIDAALK